MPSIDFTKWAEPAPFRGAAKQFITDAQIIDDNNTNCEQSLLATPTIPTKAVGNEEKGSAKSDADCNTASGHTEQIQQTPSDNLITLQISVNHTATRNKDTQSVHDCTQDLKEPTDECLKQLALSNEIPKAETVLKYVYKNDGKSYTNEKSSPHPLNSLRKKRSLINENITVSESKTAPLIVNYETLHSPEDIKLSEPLTRKSIQNAALADFDIETVHANKNSSSRSSEESKESDRSNSVESTEREHSSESKQASGERNDSSKRQRNSKYIDDDNSSRENLESNESGENYNSKEKDDSKERHSKDRKYSAYSTPKGQNNRHDSSESSDKSFEKYEEKEDFHPRSQQLHSRKQYSDESDERDSKSREEVKDSRENINSSEDNKFTYKGNRESNKQPKGIEKLRYKEDSDENPDGTLSHKDTHSQENSAEIKEKSYLRSKPVKDSITPEKLTNGTHNTPLAIQDVDLGDFSYERIQVNDKGQVVTTGENNNKEKILNIKAPSKPETTPPLSSEQISLASAEDLTEPLNDKYDSNKEPISINDGEIKPVVEINSDNSESPEENTSQALKNESEKDDSLETILGTKINSNEKSEEIVSDNKENEKTDVKQEFERIPVNYKHKNENENDQKANNKNDESKSKNNTPNSEGTLDALKPIDVNYDEQLHFKFDDVGIKLPEIKLPEDVLDYNYEEPSYLKKNGDQKEKDRFYHYSGELTAAKPNTKTKSYDNHDDDDDEHDYYGYYGKENKKQDYKKKKSDREEDEADPEGEDANDEEDHEDLYERFVRERFGKTGSFQERSEKLQDARVIPNDEKLYNTVKNILKKTENIQKQADKSGDPNAGFAWTLEYGENL
ncbi:unnamed protein product [Diatraea saccharalis]|uniref:Uncharacterized protein n=1 Tax=Diatraea saccharalis TaxID=40085 RepID=A0A9N9R0X4_9NEOP|nr:unnamed protein product [Diatraea saccharalis]